MRAGIAQAKAPRAGTAALRRCPSSGLGLVIVASATFAGIAYITRGGAFARADQVFLAALQPNVSERAVKHFRWITWFGDDARTLALLCIGTPAALLARGDKALALGLVAAVGGNGLLNAAMKRMFERSCPSLGMDPLGRGLCFPSGHTSGAVVAYGMLAYVLMRTLPERWHLPVLMTTTSLIFTVGCSRVFVQAHFPSDVLAGCASGSAWLALVVVFTESWLRGCGLASSATTQPGQRRRYVEPLPPRWDRPMP
jgi:membrane-associated phospholipid phosphatase